MQSLLGAVLNVIESPGKGMSPSCQLSLMPASRLKPLAPVQTRVMEEACTATLTEIAPELSSYAESFIAR